MDIEEIKIIRKKFGLTQSSLASQAGVSQSLIAKIESGKIDPTYTKVKQIFAFLDSLREKHEVKASEIMQKNLIFVKSSDSIKDAIVKMKKNSISQMPVVDGVCVGLISETVILEGILHKKAERVSEIMTDAPPTVSLNTSVNVVSELLSHVPLIVVSDKGKIKGVITKSDVLSNLKNY